MDPDDLETVKRSFMEADKDGNGKLDAKEMLESLKDDEDYEDLSDSQLYNIIDTYMMFADEDGDNMLNYEEILLLNQYMGDEKNPSARQLIKMMFNGVRDENKSISKKQFAQYMTESEELRDEELLTAEGVELATKITAILVKMAQEDDGGRITYDELCSICDTTE